jgi:hypothetical protein
VPKAQGVASSWHITCQRSFCEENDDEYESFIFDVPCEMWPRLSRLIDARPSQPFWP